MSTEELKLNVSEIFYSLAGEGARVGEASIFVRLQGCSAKYACAASGVICDTEFESGRDVSVQQLHEAMLIAEFSALNPDYKRKEVPTQMLQSKCKWIVWTGGEPLDQLTEEHLNFFKDLGYKLALETSGIRPLSSELSRLFDFITCSPKVAEHILAKHFALAADAGGFHVDELRYVRHVGQPGIPRPSLKAQYYYLSPHSDGQTINEENLHHCIKLCLENPLWRLSVQSHKLYGIL